MEVKFSEFLFWLDGRRHNHQFFPLIPVDNVLYGITTTIRGNIMAVTFIGADDGEFRRESDGTGSYPRILIFRLSGDDTGNFSLVQKHRMIPSVGTAHPSDARFRATGSISIIPEDESGGTICRAEIEYTTGDLSDNETTRETAPWELAPSTFQFNSETIAEVMKKDVRGYPVRTTAGNLITEVHDVDYPVCEIVYNLKEFNPKWTWMYRNTANMKQLTIMKCSFEAGFWKIRSLTGTQHTVYDNDGKEKWKYWEVSARLIGDPQKLIGRYIVLDKNGSGFTYRTVELSESSNEYRRWRKEVANVSTFMRGNKGGMIPLWQYAPAGKEIFYGTYQECSDKDSSSDKSNVSRVTEPVFLDERGQVADLVSSNMPIQKDYYLLFNDVLYVDWSPLSFPKG